MTPEPYATIIHAAQFNIAVSVVNMITTALLIYGTLMLRKGNRLNAETRRLLDDRAKRILRAASVGRNAERQDRNGLGPKDEHAVPRADEADAQP